MLKTGFVVRDLSYASILPILSSQPPTARAIIDFEFEQNNA